MKELLDTDLMPFGRYRDKPMQEVPVSYFHWLWNNGMKKETKTNNVAKYIENNIDAFKMENEDLIWD